MPEPTGSSLKQDASEPQPEGQSERDPCPLVLDRAAQSRNPRARKRQCRDTGSPFVVGQRKQHMHAANRALRGISAYWEPASDIFLYRQDRGCGDEASRGVFQDDQAHREVPIRSPGGRALRIQAAICMC